jgi:hypothetical protein
MSRAGREKLSNGRGATKITVGALHGDGARPSVSGSGDYRLGATHERLK